MKSHNENLLSYLLLEMIITNITIILDNTVSYNFYYFLDFHKRYYKKVLKQNLLNENLLSYLLLEKIITNITIILDNTISYNFYYFLDFHKRYYKKVLKQNLWNFKTYNLKFKQRCMHSWTN